MIPLSKDTLVKVFDMWNAEFHENPGKFDTSTKEMQSYGEDCAEYFLQLLSKIETLD